MKSRLLLNLALLFALTALALYAYFRPQEKPQPELKISQLAREAIVRIRMERGNAPQSELEKRDGHWHVVSPYQTRADEFQVDRFLDISQATAKEKLPAKDLSQYGLDPAPVRIMLNDQVFSFGSVNNVTNEQYVGTKDSVYLLPPFLGYGIPTDPVKLISHKLLGDDEKPVEFDFGRWRVAEDDKGAWSIKGTAPRNDIELSNDALNQWVGEWQLASSLAAEPYKDSERGERVSIRLASGRSVTIVVLSRAPDVQLLRTDENVRYQLGAEAGGRLLDPYRITSKK